MCAGSPSAKRLFCVIIVREIVVRNFYGQAFAFIAEIFLAERTCIIFGMSAQVGHLLSRPSVNGFTSCASTIFPSANFGFTAPPPPPMCPSKKAIKSSSLNTLFFSSILTSPNAFSIAFLQSQTLPHVPQRSTSSSPDKRNIPFQ